MKKNRSKFLVGAAAGFVNGLFGAAGGTVLVPCMERILDYKPYKAHATAIAIILPMSIVSGFLYLNSYTPDLCELSFIIAGGMAGGALGAILLKKISPLWLHRIFGIFMCMAALKMVIG